MQRTTVAIDQLHDNPANARRIGSTSQQDEELAASLRARGLLQPILCRANGEGYTILAGHRRTKAARSLGWSEIPAFVTDADPADDVAISAAENMVRKPLHIVDQWRAVKALVEGGTSLEAAADTLGLPARTARRFERLGRIAPEILDMVEQTGELPSDYCLSVIVTAPLPDQLAAHTTMVARRSPLNSYWSMLAGALEKVRIPRDRAAFDVERSGIVFEEDLFAEPGSEGQFTTSETDRFLELQNLALDEEIAYSNGRLIKATLTGYNSIAVPRKYQPLYGAAPLKKWRHDDPRRVLVAVIPGGYGIGKIERLVVEPREKRVKEAEPEGAKAALESEVPAPSLEETTRTFSKIRLEIEVEYDADAMYSDDEESRAWFMDTILGGGGELILHSNEIGDAIGAVTVLRKLAEPAAD